MAAARTFHERGGLILTAPGYYGFGIDSHYHTLMDFGGHRETFDLDLVDTARREAQEESFGLLNYEREDLLTSPHLTTDETLMFFVPCREDPATFTQHFTRQLLLANLTKAKIESCGVYWIAVEDLETYLAIPEFWYPPVHRAVQTFAAAKMIRRTL